MPREEPTSTQTAAELRERRRLRRADRKRTWIVFVLCLGGAPGLTAIADAIWPPVLPDIRTNEPKGATQPGPATVASQPAVPSLSIGPDPVAEHARRVYHARRARLYGGAFLGTMVAALLIGAVQHETQWRWGFYLACVLTVEYVLFGDAVGAHMGPVAFPFLFWPLMAVGRLFRVGRPI